MESARNSFSNLTKTLFVVFGLIMFFLHVFGTYSFSGTAFLGLVILLAGLLFVIYIITALVTRSRSALKVAISLFITVAIAIFCGNWVNDYFREQSFKKAEEIAKSLETYYNDKSYYPETLDQLFPVYMDEIPKPWMGLDEGQYIYKKNGEYYSITFSLPAWMLASYNSREKSWTIND
jgi:hypothetical protein